jgi:hypothetical protein
MHLDVEAAPAEAAHTRRLWEPRLAGQRRQDLSRLGTCGGGAGHHEEIVRRAPPAPPAPPPARSVMPSARASRTSSASGPTGPTCGAGSAPGTTAGQEDEPARGRLCHSSCVLSSLLAGNAVRWVGGGLRYLAAYSVPSVRTAELARRHADRVPLDLTKRGAVVYGRKSTRR